MQVETPADRRERRVLSDTRRQSSAQAAGWTNLPGGSVFGAGATLSYESQFAQSVKYVRQETRLYVNIAYVHKYIQLPVLQNVLLTSDQAKAALENTWTDPTHVQDWAHRSCQQYS